MRLLIIALIALLLLNIAIRGNLGSILGALITPDAMVDV